MYLKKSKRRAGFKAVDQRSILILKLARLKPLDWFLDRKQRPFHSEKTGPKSDFLPLIIKSSVATQLFPIVNDIVPPRSANVEAKRVRIWKY